MKLDIAALLCGQAILRIFLTRSAMEKRHVLFKGIRVRSFLSAPKTVTTIASSEIVCPDECPAELWNVQPNDVPPDNLETIHAERIMLVSRYTEYASCPNCKRKISDISVTDSADLKSQYVGLHSSSLTARRKSM